MEFFFNELSIHDQFSSQQDFRAAIGLFGEYRKSIRNAGFRFYIHRGILERPALGNKFRKGVQANFEPQQVKTLMNWFYKSDHYLPDEAYTDTADRFICHFPEGSGEGNRDVTGSAMAECAFRKIIGEEVCSISLEQSDFVWSPIKVSLEQNFETTLENDYTHPSLVQRIEGLLPGISSWTILLGRIGQLPNVTVEPYVLERLRANPFAQNVAEGVYVLANALSEMATAPSLEKFNELFAKYATGEKARFSDSSSSEKDNFKGALSFDVDGENRLCPYHGKVKIQQYRIHLVARPAFGRPARIVFIGPKLTKD